MIICDSLRAVNMATIPVALAFGGLTAAQLIANAFIGGVCYVFFSAAEETSLPNIVGSGQLTAAVSAQETSMSVSGVLAPSLGGSLLSIFESLAWRNRNGTRQHSAPDTTRVCPGQRRLLSANDPCL